MRATPSAGVVSSYQTIRVEVTWIWSVLQLFCRRMNIIVIPAKTQRAPRSDITTADQKIPASTHVQLHHAAIDLGSDPCPGPIGPQFEDAIITNPKTTANPNAIPKAPNFNKARGRIPLFDFIGFLRIEGIVHRE